MDFKTKEELFGYLKEQEARLAQLQETIDNQNTAVDDEVLEEDVKTDVEDEETVSDDEIDEITDMLNL